MAMFDNYTLKARVYPMIILFFPVVIIGVAFSFQFETIYLFLSSIGIVGALMYLFAQFGRDLGKSKEQDLWKLWGGAPTTQLLRLRDSKLDIHTKKRYHKKLQTLCPVHEVPDLVLEKKNKEAADDVYKTWTRFLIAKSRDPKKFGLLLKDNTSYGFRRNLWGLKPYGILLTISLIVANYGFWFFSTNRYNPISFSENFKYSELALILILFLWIFKITSAWIKIPAFTYAERLYETLDSNDI